MNQNISTKEEEGAKPEFENLSLFLKEFEALPSAEVKLRFSIDFMKKSLAQTGAPFFRSFWEVRKYCLPLFKEPLAATLRAELWREYVDLTREGRRLKNLLDEETAFAVEQIEIAISALEKEISNYEEEEKAAVARDSFLNFAVPETLAPKMDVYSKKQYRLDLLNVYASRIHGLRKELMKTEMRIKHKNKFFERLSHLGDKVFPVRKELIVEVSSSFMEDVSSFVEEHFSEAKFSADSVRRHVFFFREEIKAFQSAAKVFTLNTHAFTKTREQLSACWDMLKGMEKELKKEVSQARLQSQANHSQVSLKIKEVSQEVLDGKKTVDEAYAAFDDIARWMRELDLTHYDVRNLKENLRAACLPFEQKRLQDEEQKREKEREDEKRKRDEIEKYKEKVELLKSKIKEGDACQLEIEFEACRQELVNLPLPKREKQLLERVFKDIRDGISEKKEQALLTLSDDDKASLCNLLGILEQRKQRRCLIKAQIEEYRRVLGGSTLDFEKAMEFNQLMGQEKERLEKMDEGISEIESKINQVKRKAASP